MRKRTIRNIADHLFWFLVAILPLILYVIDGFRNGAIAKTMGAIQAPESMFNDWFTLITGYFGELSTDFGDFMSSFINENGIIYTSLNGLFGVGGALPLFGSNIALLAYMTWFCTVEIVHLAVDFIVFIPRLCHKWQEKLTQNE